MWDYELDGDEEIPPGAWQCPYCGHMVGVYYDDGDGCAFCCPFLDQDEESMKDAEAKACCTEAPA